MFYAFLEIEKTYIEICDIKCQNSISKKKNNLRHVKYFGVPEIHFLLKRIILPLPPIRILWMRLVRYVPGILQ